MAQTSTATGTIAGYFEDHADAERAVSALQDAGFTSAHLGVAYRGGNTSATSSTSASGSGTVAGTASNAAHAVGEKAEGAWDKFKNFFTGDEPEAYADERSRSDLATREITSDDNSGYGRDDFHQTLTGASVPEDRSRYLGNRFGNSEGGAVVTVNAPGRETEAREILTRYGADLGDNAASYDYSANTADASTGNLQNIQLLGEVLRVHKDRINRGEVRIRKETITDTQTIQVPVTREELVIERHPVSGTAQASGQIGETGEIRIPLTEERASADTATVVREEVSVGKRAIEETRDVSGQVRREELVVDDETKTVRDR